MSKLPLPVGEELEDGFTEQDIAHVGAQLAAKRRAAAHQPAQSSGTPVKWGLAIAAAALLGFFAWGTLDHGDTQTMADRTVAPPTTVGPVHLEDGRLPSTLEAPARASTTQAGTPAQQAFRFNEGSTATLAANTRLTTEQNDSKRVTFSMSEGEVRLFVAPKGPRTWTLRTAIAEIEVVGTEFSVRQTDSMVRVDVFAGVVKVRSPYLDERERTLTAAEHLEVHKPEDAETPTEQQSDEATNEAPANATAKKSWRVRAKAKQFDRAYDQLGEGGVAKETKRSQTASELFDLADVARLSGHPKEAVAPLADLVRRFPHDRRAGLASFMLGRVYMDSIGDAAEAAAAFERALQLRVPSSLVESAYARGIEAHLVAGQRAEAKRLIRAYRAKFPTGHYADRVESWEERATR